MNVNYSATQKSSLHKWWSIGNHSLLGIYPPLLTTSAIRPTKLLDPYVSRLLWVLGKNPHVMRFDRLLRVAGDELLVKKQMLADEKNLTDIMTPDRGDLLHGCDGT